MTPWKPTAFHLLLSLTGLEAQEIAHLLTLASLHPSVQLSQPSRWSPNSRIYPSGKWGDTEKAGKNGQKAPQKSSKESHRDKCVLGVEHILQKAGTPPSIRTCCLSNKSCWQTQLTPLKKTVSVNDRESKNRRWKGRETSKEQELYKPGGKRRGHLSSPSMEMWRHMPKE